MNPRLAPSEFEESCWLASWLEIHRIFFIHPANEGKRSGREGFRLKRIGLLPGTADFLIFDTPPARPELKGVAVELKAEGGKPTPQQIEFLAGMRERGWGGFWIAGGEAAAMKLKEEFGYGQRR